jgi:hypothetical protein
METDNEFQCHLVLAIVSNAPVIPHKDKGDAGDTIACSTWFGGFDGGDFCMSFGPNLKHRFRMGPDDGFCALALISHCVTSFVGERASIVWFSKSNGGSLVQNRVLMSKPDQEAYDKKKQLERAKKDADHEERLQTEISLIQQYRPAMEDNGVEIPRLHRELMDQVPNSRKQLSKASSAKESKLSDMKKNANESAIDRMENGLHHSI